jgi:hypothetical protein
MNSRSSFRDSSVHHFSWGEQLFVWCPVASRSFCVEDVRGHDCQETDAPHLWWTSTVYHMAHRAKASFGSGDPHERLLWKKILDDAEARRLVGEDPEFLSARFGNDNVVTVDDDLLLSFYDPRWDRELLLSFASLATDAVIAAISQGDNNAA